MSNDWDRDDPTGAVWGNMSRKIIQDDPPKIMFDPAKLKLVDPKTLKMDPHNRNKHPPEQINRLVKLYKKFGMRWPVLVSEKSGVVKAGEGRLLAALKCSMPQVLVSYQEFETSDLEYAFGVSDNAIASWADLNLSDIAKDIEGIEDLDEELLGIEDLSFLDEDQSDLVDEVNAADENEEWVKDGDMPEFFSDSDYIKLIFHFKTEEDREKFVADQQIKIDKKMNKQWIVHK